MNHVSIAPVRESARHFAESPWACTFPQLGFLTQELELSIHDDQSGQFTIFNGSYKYEYDDLWFPH